MAPSKYSAGVYGQDRLANQLYGTPGVDRSAGAAYGQLAQGAGQVLQEEQRTADVRNANILSGVMAVGSFIGQAMGKIKEAQQKEAQAKQMQKNMLDDYDISQAETGFNDAANGMLDNMQNEQYLDRPEEAQQPFRDFMDQQSDLIYQRFQDNPRAIAKLSASLEQAKVRQNEKMSNWSFSQRSANAQHQAKNIRPVGLEKIAKIRNGDIRNNLDEFNGIVDDHLKQIKNLPMLGKRFIETESMVFRQQAGPAFYQTLINNTRKLGPEEQLGALSDVRQYLDKNEDLGIFLDAGDKNTLLNKLDHEDAQAYGELQLHRQIDENLASNRILQGRIELSSYKDNVALQNDAKELAKQQAAGLQAKAEQVASDPRLNDKAKMAIISSINKQMGMYHSLSEQATSNINHVEAEQRTAARHAQTESNAAARAKKQATTAAIAQAKQEAGAELLEMRKEYTDLILEDPIGNRNAIIQMNAKIEAFVNAKHAAGHLSNSTAERASRQALAAGLAAQRHQPKERSKIFGILPNPVDREAGTPTTLKPSDPKLQSINSQYVQQMRQLASQMQSDDLTEKRATQLGLSEAGRAEYEQVAAGIDALRITQQEKESRKRVALQRAARKGIK